MKIIAVLAVLAIAAIWIGAAVLFGYAGFIIGALIMTALVGTTIVIGSAG